MYQFQKSINSKSHAFFWKKQKYGFSCILSAQLPRSPGQEMYDDKSNSQHDLSKTQTV